MHYDQGSGWGSELTHYGQRVDPIVNRALDNTVQVSVTDARQEWRSRTRVDGGIVN